MLCWLSDEPLYLLKILPWLPLLVREGVPISLSPLAPHLSREYIYLKELIHATGGLGSLQSVRRATALETQAGFPCYNVEEAEFLLL